MRLVLRLPSNRCSACKECRSYVHNIEVYLYWSRLWGYLAMQASSFVNTNTTNSSVQALILLTCIQNGIVVMESFRLVIVPWNNNILFIILTVVIQYLHSKIAIVNVKSRNIGRIVSQKNISIIIVFQNIIILDNKRAAFSLSRTDGDAVDYISCSGQYINIIYSCHCCSTYTIHYTPTDAGGACNLDLQSEDKAI